MLNFFRFRSNSANENPKDEVEEAEVETAEEVQPKKVTHEDLIAYREALNRLDAATCEAMAVGQHTANRLVAPTIGYSTHVSARMSMNAQQILCALPKTRWVKRDFDTWDISAIAPFARSILEGYLLFRYLIDAPTDKNIQRLYVQVMHMYDCKRRQDILKHELSEASKTWFVEQESEIRSRLESMPDFTALSPKTQKNLLQGKHLMITERSELISAIGLDQNEFDKMWNYLSQYSHMFSFTFYRVEANGRGTGLLNPADIDALTSVTNFASSLIEDTTNHIVEIFPDAQSERNGINSKFAPGPSKNLPRHMKRKRKP